MTDITDFEIQVSNESLGFRKLYLTGCEAIPDVIEAVKQTTQKNITHFVYSQSNAHILVETSGGGKFNFEIARVTLHLVEELRAS